MWITILIVCVIFGFTITPIDRAIKRRVRSKWLSFILRFTAYFIILYALYAIADLLGFSIGK